MSEWAQLANTTGVALAVLAAIGIAFYRMGRLLSRKFLGNPESNPPIPGFVDRYLDQQQQFFDAVKVHTKTHSEALAAMTEMMAKHDGFSTKRTELLNGLIDMHTNESLPGSTAEAIKHVRQLRKAAMATCDICRELACGEHAEQLRKHCDGIEAIFNEQA